eukprot:TRINITY_DN8626_c0_g1_i4.p1 TRINITY_DN8626_c0_g1~~TRINITY_DN8626_c0_g1_i4.p1  ORF type:complete len:841 (+),score=154.41 TRINITY_DN8626_c0_g1_i4:147-2669(+)
MAYERAKVKYLSDEEEPFEPAAPTEVGSDVVRIEEEEEHQFELDQIRKQTRIDSDDEDGQSPESLLTFKEKFKFYMHQQTQMFLTFNFLRGTLLFYFSIILIYVLLAAAIIPARHHLPSVVSADVNSQLFSGERAYGELKVLTEDIGGRPTGSYKNEVDTVNFLLERLQALKANASSSLAMEIEVQRPTGAYWEQKYKYVTRYNNITNIVVRLSKSGDAKSTERALLVSCHFDSVFTSRGAADDGVNVAIMLELLNNLVHSELDLSAHSLIFLFNGAEEQTPGAMPGAHGFITQHPWRSTIKYVINLDTTGAKGRQMLFQVRHPGKGLSLYRKSVHRPYYLASVIFQELWEYNLLETDTDFTIFSEFGHLPGLNFAMSESLYLYHMQQDNINDSISPGAIQLSGDNMLALLKNIISSDLLETEESTTTNVFYSWLGVSFLSYPKAAAAAMHSLLLIACIAGACLYLYLNAKLNKENIKDSVKGLPWLNCIACTVFVFVQPLFAIAINLALAGLMVGFGRSFSWYTQRTVGFVLYSLSTLISFILLTKIVGSLLTLRKNIKARNLEIHTLFGVNVFYLSLLMIMTFMGLGSAYLIFWWALFHAIGLLVTALLEQLLWHRFQIEVDCWFVRMVVSIILPATLTVELCSIIYADIVPTLGRIGFLGASREYPVAILVALIVSFHLLPILPYFHRFQGQGKMMVIFGIFLVIFMIIAMPLPRYTTHTPKQVFVEHLGYFPQQKGEVLITSGDTVSLEGLMKKFPEDEWSKLSKYQYTKYAEVPSVPLPSLWVSDDTHDESTDIRSVTFNVSHPETTYSSIYLVNGFTPVVGASLVDNALTKWEG